MLCEPAGTLSDELVQMRSRNPEDTPSGGARPIIQRLERIGVELNR